MDYFTKALGSLNINRSFTVVQEDPVTIPGLKHEITQATWKTDGSKASVFQYSLNTPSEAQCGKHAVATMRRLLIPGVAKFLDSNETLDTLFVVTERVSQMDFAALSETGAKYVVYYVLNTLKTIYESSNIKYNQDFGELVQNSAGFPVLTIFDNAQPSSGPILTSGEFQSLVNQVVVSHSRLRRELLAASSMGPFNFAKVIGKLETPLVKLVDNIGHAFALEPPDLKVLCSQIDEARSDLWSSLVLGFVLPNLIRTKSPIVLHVILQLLTQVDPEHARGNERIMEYIAEQFASMDRVVRLELLKALPVYIDLVTPQFVQSKIWPKMAFGFVDSEVVMRRASVASIEVLAPKVGSRQLNSELLRLLAKTHNDKDVDVRALTTTVLCKIAPLLMSNRNVISTALGRALKDPVPKCRSAALKGVLEINLPANEISEKLLGPAAGGMLDKDAEVSAEAWRVTKTLLAKIEAAATASAPSETVDSTDTSVDHIVSDALPVSSRMQTTTTTTLGEPKSGGPKFGATQDSTTNESQPSTSAANPDPAPLVEQEDDSVQDDAWGWDEEEEPVADNEEVEDAWGWDE